MIGFLLGWTLVSALLSSIQAGAPWRASDGPAGTLSMASPLGLELEGMNLRQLRMLPGIGQARALGIQGALSAARDTGRPMDWREVPGIGPKTQARVEAWLASQRPDSLAP